MCRAPGARLPSSLTCMDVRCDGSDQLPLQFAHLPRLERLRLENCFYAPHDLAPLSALAGSLTRLDVEQTFSLPAASLAALSRLQHLEFSDQLEPEDLGFEVEPEALQAVEAALPHLTALTCLVLFKEHDATLVPPGLSRLANLQLCYLQGDGPAAELAAFEPLPGGPWLRSVRWLSAGIATLLNSPAALQAAVALECIEIGHSPVSAIDWGSPAAAAFFDWLAQHPPLRQLCFTKDYSGPPLDAPEFEALLAQLSDRRPLLPMACPRRHFWGDRTYSILAHISFTHRFDDID